MPELFEGIAVNDSSGAGLESGIRVTEGICQNRWWNKSELIPHKPLEVSGKHPLSSVHPSECDQLQIIRGVQGIIRLRLGMGVLDRAHVFVVFRRFAGKFWQERTEVFESGKTSELLFDSGKNISQGSGAADLPVPQVSIRARLLLRDSVQDPIDRNRVSFLQTGIQ